MKHLATAYAVKRNMKKRGVPEQGANAADAPSPDRAGENLPGESVYPREEAMSLADAVMQAKSYRKMAQGGLVDEEPVNGLGSDNDHYAPTGAEESDTMAQDEGFGPAPLHNEQGDMDQEEARAAMRRNRLGGIMSDMRQRHFGKP